jgi:hypothetical protein
MLNVQSVPRSKHSVSAIKTSQLILYWEIIAISSEIHTEQINVFCEQTAEFLGTERCGTLVTT